MMRTIETTGVVTPDHTITLQLPDDVPAGSCKVVVSFAEEVAPERPLTANWTMLEIEAWPEGFTVSREQIYGDDGR